MGPERELLERYRFWRLRHYFKESGNRPDSFIEASWRPMIQVSFKFQHETPVSWQMEVDERLAKFHVERGKSGSERELFRPSRQVMSSSMAKERKKLKRK